jgi:hypothetical protein
MQQQTLHKTGKDSLAYLDPQIVMRTKLHMSRQEVPVYFAKAMRHYKDKEILVVLFNMGNPINFYQLRPGLVL